MQGMTGIVAAVGVIEPLKHKVRRDGCIELLAGEEGRN